MRERKVIESIGEGDWDGTDYSEKLALRRRTLEVLLDIRDLLIEIQDKSTSDDR